MPSSPRRRKGTPIAQAGPTIDLHLRLATDGYGSRPVSCAINETDEENLSISLNSIMLSGLLQCGVSRAQPSRYRYPQTGARSRRCRANARDRLPNE
jgi:hypothetical protein